MEIYWGRHIQAYVTPLGRDEVCVVVMAERVEHTSFYEALQDLPDLAQHLAGGELSSRERGAVTTALARSITYSREMSLWSATRREAWTPSLVTDCG